MEEVFLKEWLMLAQKIKGLGLKLLEEIKTTKRVENDTKKEEANEKAKEETSLTHKWGYRGVEVVGKIGSSVDNEAWVDVGDCVLREEVGIMQYSLIGQWKTKLEFSPSTKELEAWARMTWRLKGGVLIAF